MEFEFSEAKSLSNKKKHGIDFVAAQALWDDIDLLEIPAKTGKETRIISIGLVEKRHWSAVTTIRDSKIRIISVRRSGIRQGTSMKAKDFDKLFEEGTDITEFMDLSKAKRSNQKPRRVNVDFPEWMIHSLDKEAARLGVTRQSIIKVWISERLSRKSA